MTTKLHTELKKDDPALLVPGEYIDDYAVTRMISVGGFGQVFSGYHRHTHRRVAIKVESMSASIPLLRNERICLQHLNQFHHRCGEESRDPILKYYAYGKTEVVRYLVMEQCGANLRELKKATANDQFSISTSLWIMERMLSALRFIHGLGWLHRDVKPANFCIGERDVRQLFLIDFGMCRYFMETDGRPKPRKPSSAFHGTVRYASMNTHNRLDLCRWDDIWSVYYIAVEHMVGSLPWRYVSDKNQVCEMKTSMNLLGLAYGREARPPACLSILYQYLLASYQQPDTSFYQTPPYERFIHDIHVEFAHRGEQKQLLKLDWEKTHVVDPNCFGDYVPMSHPAVFPAYPTSSGLGKSYYLI